MVTDACRFCDYRAEPVDRFCRRCGGRLSADTEICSLRDRLRWLRGLLRSGGYSGLFGINTVTRKVRAIEASLRIVPANNLIQQEFEWLADEMLRLTDNHDLPLTNSVLNQCLKIMPAGLADRIQPRHTQMRQFAEVVQETDRRMAQGQVNVKAAAKWFAQTAAALERNDDYALRCLRATPEHWIRVLQAVDPKALRDAQPRLLYSQGVLALRNRRHEDAMRLFEQALAKRPGWAEATEAQGYVAARRQNIEQAIDLYRQAIQAGSTDPMTYNNLAWYLATRDRMTVSDEYLAMWAAGRAVEWAPCAVNFDTLAKVLLRVGDAANSLVAARWSRIDDPDRGDYRERMVEVCEAIDEQDRALREVDEAIMATERRKREAELKAHAEEESRGRSRPEAREVRRDLPKRQDSESPHDDSLGSSESGLSLHPISDSDDVEFALHAGELNDEDDSGLQVIALEDEGDFAASLDDDGSSNDPVQETPEEQLARLQLAATSRGDYANSAPVPRDRVHCTVFAPYQVRPAASVLIQVFAHLPPQAEQSKAEAMAVDGDASWRQKKTLATEIARGSLLEFELRMPPLEVPESTAELVWLGEPESVQFEVRIPKDVQPGSVSGSIRVRQDGKAIGRFSFQLTVSKFLPPDQQGRPTGSAYRFHSAFISYATKDRTEVMRGVQLLCNVGIQVFADVLSIDAGDRWKQKLFQAIDDCDVMFLFWSSAARKSKWVEREWRYGLKVKGEDFVHPIVIEGPPVPLPPPELSHLQFDDRVQHIIRAAQVGAAQDDAAQIDSAP